MNDRFNEQEIYSNQIPSDVEEYNQFLLTELINHMDYLRKNTDPKTGNAEDYELFHFYQNLYGKLLLIQEDVKNHSDTYTHALMKFWYYVDETDEKKIMTHQLLSWRNHSSHLCIVAIEKYFNNILLVLANLEGIDVLKGILTQIESYQINGDIGKSTVFLSAINKMIDSAKFASFITNIAKVIDEKIAEHDSSLQAEIDFLTRSGHMLLQIKDKNYFSVIQEINEINKDFFKEVKRIYVKKDISLLQGPRIKNAATIDLEKCIKELADPNNWHTTRMEYNQEGELVCYINAGKKNQSFYNIYQIYLHDPDHEQFEFDEILLTNVSLLLEKSLIQSKQKFSGHDLPGISLAGQQVAYDYTTTLYALINHLLRTKFKGRLPRLADLEEDKHPSLSTASMINSLKPYYFNGNFYFSARNNVVNLGETLPLKTVIFDEQGNVYLVTKDKNNHKVVSQLKKSLSIEDKATWEKLITLKDKNGKITEPGLALLDDLLKNNTSIANAIAYVAYQDRKIGALTLLMRDSLIRIVVGSHELSKNLNKNIRIYVAEEADYIQAGIRKIRDKKFVLVKCTVHDNHYDVYYYDKATNQVKKSTTIAVEKETADFIDQAIKNDHFNELISSETNQYYLDNILAKIAEVTAHFSFDEDEILYRVERENNYLKDNVLTNISADLATTGLSIKIQDAFISTSLKILECFKGNTNAATPEKTIITEIEHQIGHGIDVHSVSDNVAEDERVFVPGTQILYYKKDDQTNPLEIRLFARVARSLDGLSSVTYSADNIKLREDYIAMYHYLTNEWAKITWPTHSKHDISKNKMLQELKGWLGDANLDMKKLYQQLVENCNTIIDYLEGKNKLIVPVDFDHLAKLNQTLFMYLSSHVIKESSDKYYQYYLILKTMPRSFQLYDHICHFFRATDREDTLNKLIYSIEKIFNNPDLSENQKIDEELKIILETYLNIIRSVGGEPSLFGGGSRLASDLVKIVNDVLHIDIRPVKDLSQSFYDNEPTFYDIEPGPFGPIIDPVDRPDFNELLHQLKKHCIINLVKQIDKMPLNFLFEQGGAGQFFSLLNQNNVLNFKLLGGENNKVYLITSVNDMTDPAYMSAIGRVISKDYNIAACEKLRKEGAGSYLTDCYQLIPINETQILEISAFCPGGNLEDGARCQMSVDDRQDLTIQYAFQLVEMLTTFDKLNVLFSDIKPSNFLINDQGKLVISDNKSLACLEEFEKGYHEVVLLSPEANLPPHQEGVIYLTKENSTITAHFISLNGNKKNIVLKDKSGFIDKLNTISFNDAHFDLKNHLDFVSKVANLCHSYSSVLINKDKKIIQHKGITPTKAYLPPELKKEEGMATISLHDMQCYQVGLTLYEFAVGRHRVVADEKNQAQLIDFQHPVFTEGKGQVLLTVIQGLTQPDPTKRISLEKAGELLATIKQEAAKENSQLNRPSLKT